MPVPVPVSVLPMPATSSLPSLSSVWSGGSKKDLPVEVEGVLNNHGMQHGHRSMGRGERVSIDVGHLRATCRGTQSGRRAVALGAIARARASILINGLNRGQTLRAILAWMEQRSAVCPVEWNAVEADFLAAELACVPQVLPGLVTAWPACRLWALPQGLKHLRDLAGDADMQVGVPAGAATALNRLSFRVSAPPDQLTGRS